MSHATEFSNICPVFNYRFHGWGPNDEEWGDPSDEGWDPVSDRSQVGLSLPFLIYIALVVLWIQKKKSHFHF